MENKIIVLRFINRFNVGGISYNVAFLSKYISSKFKTYVIGGLHEKNEDSSKYIFDDLGLRIRILPCMYRSINIFRDMIATLFYLYYIIKFKPSIVHSHASKAGFISRIPFLFFKPKIKLVHTFHGNVFDGYFVGYKRKLIIYIERLLAKRTDLIIAISEKQKDDLIFKYKICEESKIKIIKLGFDLSRFININDSQRIYTRNSFKISEDEIVISIVGRLVPIKNHKLFIDIIALLKRSSPKKIKALVVGDGSEKNKLIQYAVSLNLKLYSAQCTDHDYDIFFTSWRRDLPEIYAASDFVLLTSFNEGTPVSIIEAMAAKKIVISTNVGGVSDIISDNSGFITSFNPESFVSIILDLIYNPSKIAYICNNAHINAIRDFNYINLCANMENEYNHLFA